MLHGFFYSHYSRDASVWMTNLGFCFNLGLSMISWFSWMQEAIALSSTKAEYMVVNSVNSKDLASQVDSIVDQSYVGSHYRVL